MLPKSILCFFTKKPKHPLKKKQQKQLLFFLKHALRQAQCSTFRNSSIPLSRLASPHFSPSDHPSFLARFSHRFSGMHPSIFATLFAPLLCHASRICIKSLTLSTSNFFLFTILARTSTGSV